MSHRSGHPWAVWALLVLAVVAEIAAMCACSGRRTFPNTADSVLVFRSTGLYRVPFPRSGSLEPSITMEGVPVPVFVATALGRESAFFYVTVKPNRYSRVAAAMLRWKPERAVRMRGARRTLEVSGRPQTESRTTKWLEKDARYLPTANLAEPWVWDALYPHSVVTKTVRIPDAVTAEPVTVTIRLWSHSSAPQNPDHHIVVRWNGAEVLDRKWDGTGVYTFTFGGMLSAGTNAISLEEPGDTGSPAEVAYLDGWGVTYQKRLDLRGGPVVWKAEANSARLSVPDGKDVWVLDVTAPMDPAFVGKMCAAGGYVKFGTVPGHEYWAGAISDAMSPEGFRVEGVDKEALASADYVIVAGDAFWEALRPLVQRRIADGMSVERVTPWAVYDNWGDGSPDPASLRRLLAWKAKVGRPARFLLLVGDARLKPWGGRVGTSIPVTFVRTRPMGETPSDLATLMGGDYPLPAFGRVPADSPDEVVAWVKKVLGWNGVPPRALVLSSDEVEFSRFADDIARTISNIGGNPTRISITGKDTRGRVIEAVRSGPLWLHYVGHGSPAVWGKTQVLTSKDAGEWNVPIAVAAWTCLSGYFVHPEVRSMAERWLLSPRGGAVLFIAPTGEGYAGDQRSLALEFYRALATEPTVGEAFRNAVLRERDNDVTEQYILFGDPALSVRPDRVR